MGLTLYLQRITISYIGFLLCILHVVNSNPSTLKPSKSNLCEVQMSYEWRGTKFYALATGVGCENAGLKPGEQAEGYWGISGPTDALLPNMLIRALETDANIKWSNVQSLIIRPTTDRTGKWQIGDFPIDYFPSLEKITFDDISFTTADVQFKIPDKLLSFVVTNTDLEDASFSNEGLLSLQEIYMQDNQLRKLPKLLYVNNYAKLKYVEIPVSEQLVGLLPSEEAALKLNLASANVVCNKSIEAVCTTSVSQNSFITPQITPSFESGEILIDQDTITKDNTSGSKEQQGEDKAVTVSHDGTVSLSVVGMILACAGILVIATFIFLISSVIHNQSSGSSEGLKYGTSFRYFRSRQPRKTTQPTHSNGEDYLGKSIIQSHSEIQSSSMNLTSEDLYSIWTDGELLAMQVDVNDIRDIKPIGSGSFGIVWLVMYRNRELASKRLKWETKNVKSKKTSRERTLVFIDEIKLCSKLDHPNIPSFVGVAWTIERDLQALFEYCGGGDLRTHLKSITKESALSPPIWSNWKYDVAIDIVEALVYVHSFALPLVHRDLKSRNVLLTSNLRGKLSDFGVSRFASVNATMTRGVGTGKWLAPEVICGSSDYDQRCDIFAYGVVLSELETQRLPYEGLKGPNGNKLMDVAILQQVAIGKLVPQFTHKCPKEILRLAHQCMALNPSDRPTAVQITYELHRLRKNCK